MVLIKGREPFGVAAIQSGAHHTPDRLEDGARLGAKTNIDGEQLQQTD